MEAFSITCTTCKSRLKVQSLSAVGEILACPKCQSMVKVEPPEGWTPPGQERAANAGEDKSEQPKWREPSPASPAQDDEAPVLPDSSWTSPASRKRLLIGSGTLVLLLLLCLVAFAVGRGRKPEKGKAQPTASREKDSGKPSDGSGNKSIAEAEPDDSKPPADPESSKNDSAADDDTGTDIDSVDTGKPTEVAEDEPPKKPVTEKAVDKDAETPAETPDGPPGLVEKGEGDPAEDTEFNAPSLLAELDKFSELMDDPTITSGSAEGDEVADVLTPDDVPDDEPTLPRPEVREVDVAARLNDPLSGIEFSDLPLADFIRFVSDFSTIPISLSPEALNQRQITPQKPVSIRRIDTTVGQVLHDVLATLELGFAQKGDQLVVVAAVATEPDSLRQVEYDLSDLASGSEDDTKEIARWITSLVSPKSWQDNGGKGVLETKGNSLIIQQSEPVHFQVLTFCEKLRISRGLRQQSSYPVELFRLVQPGDESIEGLDRPVSMNYLDDVRLVEILQRAQQQSGVHILVDWHALAESGWNPDAQFPFSVDKKPLRRMLTRLLNQMALTYRVAGPNMIQITTHERLQNRPEINFHSAGDLVPERLTAEELLSGVKSALGEVHFRDHAGAVILDPKSRYLIAALPHSQQQAVTQILARLRERSPGSAE